MTLHIEHWNLRPASTNCIFGDMYALQRLQRRGPCGPKSTIGGSYSPSAMRANGDNIKANGRAVFFKRSAVVGIVYREDLQYKL